MLEAELGTGLRDFRLELSLAVEAGWPLAIVGPSGAGKSSVLRAIAGLAAPERGSIRCSGRVWLDTAGGANLPPERRRCGYVFQDYALFESMSVRGNVAYGLGRLPRRERGAEAERMLDRFGIRALADARPAELSGGERQRVALARALASRPTALLLDEPLAALDAVTRTAAGAQLRRIIDEAAVPTVLVTHDFAEAITLVEKVAVLEEGRIVQRGRPEELAAEPVSGFVAELTGSVVLAGVARMRPDGLSEVLVEGGGVLTSTDEAPGGPVCAAVHPWEIAIEPAGSAEHGSQRNRLEATVRSVARIGNRVRVGLDTPQPLVAEVTPQAREQLGLAPGVAVTAVWKAAATRLTPR
ncbi:MAG TPA: ABC transporter ATP-binding protein [Solirubrobacterales bacterium]|nr:ABC transporter ATP-binding protein [Solirubrobacterales bacterium]